MTTKTKKDSVLEQTIELLNRAMEQARKQKPISTDSYQQILNEMVEQLRLLRNKNLDLDFEQFSQLFRHVNAMRKTFTELALQKWPSGAENELMRNAFSKAEIKDLVDAAERFQNLDDDEPKQ
jgi:hypothetical protein